MMSKKLVAMGTTVAMLVGMMGMTAFAASTIEATGDTTVIYNNTYEIVDPDGADWAVVIPKTVTFTDDVKSVDATVELIDKSGNGLPEYGVSVKVQSGNGFFLQDSAEDDANQLRYELVVVDGETYDSYMEDSTDKKTVSSQLKENTTTQDITFNLLETATVSAEYTDTLTFTITELASNPD